MTRRLHRSRPSVTQGRFDATDHTQSAQISITCERPSSVVCRRESRAEIAAEIIGDRAEIVVCRRKSCVGDSRCGRCGQTARLDSARDRPSLIHTSSGPCTVCTYQLSPTGTAAGCRWGISITMSTPCGPGPSMKIPSSSCNRSLTPLATALAALRVTFSSLWKRLWNVGAGAPACNEGGN